MIFSAVYVYLHKAMSFLLTYCALELVYFSLSIVIYTNSNMHRVYSTLTGTQLFSFSASSFLLITFKLNRWFWLYCNKRGVTVGV